MGYDTQEPVISTFQMYFPNEAIQLEERVQKRQSTWNDALSRWPLPDEYEDGVDDFNDIIINCVHVERKDAAFRILHKISQDSIENLEIQSLTTNTST